MWSILSLTVEGQPAPDIYVSDGAPVGARRGPAGTSYRFGIVGLGYLDVTDTGHQPGGPHYWQLVFKDQVYWYDGEGAPAIAVASDGSLTITGDGNQVASALESFAPVESADIEVIHQMESAGLVPYAEIPPDGRPFSAVAELAGQYFGFTSWARELALSLYDWTTADFFRMDLLRLYRYSSLMGEPLDAAGIVTGIWTADWPPYTHSDPTFMGSLMMTPCSSEAEVSSQYSSVYKQLQSDLAALARVTQAAMVSMPRTSVLQKPQLFSGQVAISNLGMDAMAIYFDEYAGNAGPVGQPMGMPIEQALATFMQPGSVLHTKTFMSFTDSADDAIHYSNGIVIELNPAAGPVWVQGAHVTSLSDEADKIEYAFALGSGFAVNGFDKRVIDGKSVIWISMTEQPST